MSPTPARCDCGHRFTRQTRIGGRMVGYWCPRCDEHGVGCANREHPAGKCTYQK